MQPATCQQSKLYRLRGVRRLQMKTKFVSAIFLLLLVWVTSPSRACICTDEIKNASAVISAVVLKTAPKDLCSDCGHTRSCCSSHQELAVTAGSAVEIPDATKVATVQAPDLTFAFRTEPKKHQHLRAPPLLLQPLTPFSAKKVLLI